MSFTKINPPGWASGDTLTHTQITALDTDHANAVDKTGDTVTGAVAFGAGSSLTIAAGITATVSDGGALVVAGTETISGTANVATGGALTVQSGASFTLNTGSSNSFRELVTVTKSAGANGTIQTASGGRFVLGDSDWVQMSSARALTGKSIHFGAITLPQGTTGWQTTLQGLQSTAAGATIQFPVQRHLMDGATLATVDIYVYPAPGSHGSSLGGSVTLYRRTLTAGSGLPGWTSIGTASLSATGWGDGNVKKVTITPAVALTSSDFVSIGVVDENVGSGTYPVSAAYNIILGAVLNYTITEQRPD